MNRLYKLGKNRLQSEFNISKLIKNLRYLKILIKNSFMNEKINFMIYHSNKNILDIDADKYEASDYEEKKENTINMMEQSESLTFQTNIKS